MTIRNLEYAFKPDSIAVISAGKQTDTPDTLLIRNLLRSGFDGPVMPVNPDRRALKGIVTYKDVASLPLIPDLAIITTALETAPLLIDELGRRGTRAVVLLSHEMLKVREDGGQGLTQAMLDAAKPHLLRIVGPDCLGIAAPHNGLNATLSHTPLSPGHIGLLTESCAVMRTIIDRAASRHIGFSHLVSVGAKIDVDFGDLLDYLALDTRTRAILVYLENIHHNRKFMSAARIAARMKPVIALKPHHYGDDPIEDAIYDTAFRRAGILRVDDIEQLFHSAETLATLKPVANNRLALLGNSRSIGLLASDRLIQTGGRLVELTESTRSELAQIIPQGFHTDNPVDLGDQAGPEAYGKALELLLKEPETDGVLVLHAPTSIQNGLDNARAVIERAAGSRRVVLASWLGGNIAEPARQLFKEHRLPSYDNPDNAVQAFTRLAQYRRNQEQLMETPPSIPEAFTTNPETARRVIGNALTDARQRLNALETHQVLAAYDIPVLETRLATDPAEAAAQAEVLGNPVALKILSTDIDHKSDIGGIALGLETSDAVLQTATAMLERIYALAPQATIDGFLVQPMKSRNGAYELTIGVRTGQGFGPVLRFGHGGTETEVINDIAYALPPLNMLLATELMSRTRIYSKFSTSHRRRADVDALALTLIKVSQMVIDLGEIVELDINPLWANSNGVIVLDASIQIAPSQGSGTDRLAIRPYPKELEQQFSLPDGRRLCLRPIMPEDEPSLQAMVRRIPAEDLRLRFLRSIKELYHAMAARLTQLDYDREMALAITEPGVPGKANIWGVVRLATDPDMERAEYAILLDQRMSGLGLGPMMMRRIIEYAKNRGIKELFGEVLRENETMLNLCRAFGFTIEAVLNDPGMMHVSLNLQ